MNTKSYVLDYLLPLCTDTAGIQLAGLLRMTLEVWRVAGVVHQIAILAQDFWAFSIR